MACSFYVYSQLQYYVCGGDYNLKQTHKLSGVDFNS